MMTVLELEQEKQLLATQITEINVAIKKVQEKCDHDYKPGEHSSIDYFSEVCTICTKVRWY